LKSKTQVYIRADGNSQIGLGHVIRSLSLAEMVGVYFDCHFIIRNPPSILKSQILDVCKSIIELPDTDNNEAEVRMLTRDYLNGKEIVILDGYHFQTEYQRIIKNKGCYLVCIDDIHAYHFVADAIINHIGGITEDRYSKESYTKLFLGPEYSLIRKEFWQSQKNGDALRRESNSYSNCLLCMGGSDPNNCTQKMLFHLTKIKTIESINIVIGETYPFEEELKLANEIIANKNIKIYKSVNAQLIADLINISDFGVFPASTIALEAHALKLPMMIGYHVENQIEAYDYWVNMGFAIGLGEFNFVTEKSLYVALENLHSIGFLNLTANETKLLNIFRYYDE